MTHHQLTRRQTALALMMLSVISTPLAMAQERTLLHTQTNAIFVDHSATGLDPYDAGQPYLDDEFPLTGIIADVAQSRDGQMLYVSLYGNLSGAVRITDARTGAHLGDFESSPLPGESTPYLSRPARVEVLPNGDVLVIEADSKVINRYTANGEFLRTYQAPFIQLYANMARGPDGLLYTAGNNASVVAFDLDTGEVVRTYEIEQIDTPFSGNKSCTNAAFGPDGMLYLTIAEHPTMYRLDTATGDNEPFAMSPAGPYDRYRSFTDITFDDRGHILVHDQLCDCVREFDEAGNFRRYATPSREPNVIRWGEVVFLTTPACSLVDIAAPFGTLNFADVQTFLGSFSVGLPAADLAAPLGTFNFADVQTFLGLFNAGCP